MSLRRWRKTIADAGKTVSSKVSGAVDSVKETASDILDNSFTMEKAKKEVISDLEKGLRVFDEIGLPKEIGSHYKLTITNFAIEKLIDAWEHPDRKDDK